MAAYLAYRAVGHPSSSVVAYLAVAYLAVAFPVVAFPVVAFPAVESYSSLVVVAYHASQLVQAVAFAVEVVATLCSYFVPYQVDLLVFVIALNNI